MAGRAAHQPASKEPDRLCHTEKMAPGSAASGPKYSLPSVAARPEFCIPTSSARVRHTLSSKPSRRPPQ